MPESKNSIAMTSSADSAPHYLEGATGLERSSVQNSRSTGRCATPVTPLAEPHSEPEASEAKFQCKADANDISLAETLRHQINALQVTLKFLEMEIAMTKGKNTHLKSQNTALQQEISRVRRHNRSLIAENDALKEEIFQLFPSSDEESQDLDLDYGSTLSESIFETLIRNPGEFI
ncbi:hypothetical protein VNI00_013499 [Paramarasmius palmivorus]|uniref:Uncharacterized protein n=1 Tax=Paramarasmius palmivorus TaxID=297713 RepID=A0AAW0C0J7_9AGAR